MLPTTFEALSVLPWVALVLVAPLLFVRRPRLSSFAPPPPEQSPLVSVIVPARNESTNISVCVASLLNSVYPRFEIIVVDDGSIDGTADIVRILAEHAQGRLELVDGEPLPDGWLGKPWACWQGAQRARGELLLFTDADTRHDEMLLGRTVGALQERRADLVSLLPRQLMLTFWERLVLPQIFTLIMLRYYDLERANRTGRPRDIIANGQFMLFRREAYEAIGGHEALRADVVEDQRLAQRLVEVGRRVTVAHAQELMDTRMYRSLSGIVEGWSKNLATGSRQASPAWAAPVVPWAIALLIVALWLIPPGLLLLGMMTPLVAEIPAWAAAATSLSVLFWTIALASMRVPLLYAIGYPIGAVVAVGLFVRSAIRGPHVLWKGREYRLDGPAMALSEPPSERGP